MTNIIDMAREAGINNYYLVNGVAELERFATLHRAAIIAELCAGMEMPEPVALRWPNEYGRHYFCGYGETLSAEISPEKLFTLDQMREAIASAVVKALANFNEELRSEGVYPKWTVDALCESAVVKERELCAKVCESFKQGNSATYIDDDWADMCAEAIRARS